MLSALIKFIFYQPTFNLLIFLYNIFQGNLGLAIIAIAAIAKLITIPITKKQLKSAEKMKGFQQKSKKIREKYSKNTEKMNDELMKLSSKYMPVQLAGCLPLIISILLLIQIRGVVINLVNQGYHAYNEVAYLESFKKDEDSFSYEVEEDLEKGEHTLKILVEATNGRTLEKEYKFEIVDDIKERIEEIKENELEKDKEERRKEQENLSELTKKERETNISIFSEKFDERKSDIKHSIVLSRFLLIFPSEVKSVNLLKDETPQFNIYLRPPSREFIKSIRVFLDEKEVTESLHIQKGEKLNLDFGSIDLSKVGAEYIGNWSKFIPYLLLALGLGITQFFISKMHMGIRGKKEKKEDKESKKKKKKEKIEEDVDFQDVMQQSSKQMVFLMPIFSMMMSLGVGGLHIFPSAVSLFWTAQNTFVIIQMLVTKNKEIRKYILSKVDKFKA